MASQIPEDGLSHITPIGYCDSPNCGYCHGKSADGRPQNRYSYYASAHSLSPGLYQTLVDRCWRRSGTLLYRPNPKQSCCPHYTLRLDAPEFHATRDQRQAINRFNRYVTGDTYTREAARIHPRSREEAKKRDTVFDLAERVHEAESKNLPLLPVRPSRVETAEAKPERATISPAHAFEVTLEPDTFTEEKYAVFENYQRIVHKEPPSKISRKGFTNFLCNSPLRHATLKEKDGRERRLGSFHQCYRLDGKLVAIGVLDLLPGCVSAVYFLYHESIHIHSPGKLGAMREIALAREEGYRWWYSGYYIHSCPKMRYKIDYAPQYVLDPETLGWDLLDKEALAIFDRQKYVSLSRERKNAEEASKENQQEERPDAGDERAANVTMNNDETTGNGRDANDDGDGDGDGSGDSDDEFKDRLLLKSNMPGIMSVEEVERLGLDDILIETSLEPRKFPVKYLAIWNEGGVRDPGSFKNTIGELVAAMGSDLMPQLCLDYRRPKH